MLTITTRNNCGYSQGFKMNAKVILFKKDTSIISLCISKVTGSNITHSGVYFDGQIFDASEKRGKFGSAKVKSLKNRNVEVYNLGASDTQLEAWLVRHSNKAYDYSGILQWLLFFIFGRFVNRLKISSNNKVYCFEATAALITRVTGLKFPKNLHGDHLKRVLGLPVYKGPLKGFLENAD